ncbi:hypothetical protein NCF86_00145 [Pelagerythrobacter marinus]|nr:hypothetical protein NCF86_00145 [Pelagerythrobacter marinus]
MSRIFNALAPFRSHIIAMVGVLAVCGIGAAIIAWQHIQAQNRTIEAKDARIGDLVSVNDRWAAWAAQQQKLRDLEQRNTRLLQDQLAAIEQASAAQSEQLRELEASNAEVKELLGRKLPADLRRVLEGR